MDKTKEQIAYECIKNFNRHFGHTDQQELFKAMQAYADQELKKVSDFIRDIGKLLGEDNLGFDGISWTIDDFKNAIDQEKRKEAISFLKFATTFTDEAANNVYDQYLQSLTQHT